MKVVCSGCGILLGEKDSKIFGEDAVSHSMCQSCLDAFMAEIGVPLEEYLETVSAPIVSVSPEGIVGTANKLARQLLGKDLPVIAGLPPGDVFECKYAKQPEGCGNTLHCSGCAIRSTVMDTVETGQPHEKVPAYLQQGSEDSSKKLELLISTEKKGGVVFLTVDRVTPAAG